MQKNMEKINLGNKKLIMGPLSKKHIAHNYVKSFMKFINSLVEENAKILANKKFIFKQEKNFLNSKLNEVRSRKTVYLLAEDITNKKSKKPKNPIIAGTTEISLGKFKQEKIGTYGMAIAKPYRGMGLGKYLTKKILEQAKKLRPKPKLIRLEVFENNKPAINLYKKMGFKKVAKIPKAVEHSGKLIAEFVMIKDFG